MPKRFIIDIWYGSKYTPKVVQEWKINLKKMSPKMVEKTVHFLNVELAGGRDIQRYQKQQFVHVLLNSWSWKLRKIHNNIPASESFFHLQPATLLKTGHRHTYSPKILQIFLGRTFLQKTPCELVLKGEFYEKWQTNNLIIKRYRKVDSSFKE